MATAPVALFVYNRPEHTRKTLESLMANQLASESNLFIFADGAKPGASEKVLKDVQETRKVIREKKWCGKVIIFESEVNKGLAQSIIEGVSKIVDEFGKIIVLEDDLLSSPFFLKFMNDALSVYETSTDVACISGYIYPVKGNLPASFFIKGADCWGWATWKRAWNIFEKDGSKLLQQLEERSLISEFDFAGSYPFAKMLKDQIGAKNDSWAIRWYASAFLTNRYCLYPGESLIQNIGIDGSGTHSGDSKKWQVNLSSKAIDVKQLAVSEQKENKRLIIDYFESLKSGNEPFIRKLMNQLKWITQGDKS